MTNESDIVPFLVLKYGFIWDISTCLFKKWYIRYFTWNNNKELFDLFDGKKYGYEFREIIRKWNFVFHTVGTLGLCNEKFSVCKMIDKERIVKFSKFEDVEKGENKELIDRIVDIAFYYKQKTKNIDL